MILITGAAGKTGLSVIRAVSTREVVRAFVYRPGYSKLAEEAGAVEVVVGDMRKAPDFERAMRGIYAVYHICPNASPFEVEIGKTAISAAQDAGVGLFVYHSVLHPQIEAMPHHWHKMRVEELLFSSGLPYTILQPAAYMQNFLGQLQYILEQGVYEAPYSVEARVALVDLKDIAKVAAKVLTLPGHLGATYELVGEVLSQMEVAEAIGSVIGRPVEARTIPIAEWKQRAKEAGTPEPQTETLVKMFRYYNEYGLAGNSTVLSWLLGQPPTELVTCVKRELSPK